jgi:protease PrsW
MTSLVHAVVILLPVITFLSALVVLDSYKLVAMRVVVGVVACGSVIALASYYANGAILEATDLDIRLYIRYVAPLVEEALKALVIVALISTHRVGFLVDAAILGFAAGAGFAAVENVHYLQAMPDAGLGTWIVRGFGTALMHGGATAIFGVAGMAMVDRAGKAGLFAFVPGFAVAVLLHSLFNHLLGTPKLATVAIVLALPPVFYAIFRASEPAVGQWLGHGFDADTEMLQLIHSGALSDSPIGQYLHTLRGRFEGMVVADLLSYLRLYTELAIRAKGILMMRETGFNPPIDEGTREKFTEMRYLEKSIGPTGLRAIQPMLRMSHKDLWQLYMLGK